MDKMINRVSEYLQLELRLTEETTEIVAYGFYVFFSTIISFLSIMIVSWWLGVFKLALIAVFTTSGLRVLSGGAHSASLRNCVLLGVMISPSIAWIAKGYHSHFSSYGMILLVLLTGIFSLWSIFTYAPADTPNKPVINPEVKNKLRRLSLLYLLVWFILIMVSVFRVILPPRYDLVLASTLGLLWQVFSLTPTGYRLVAYIDRLLP